MNCSFNIRYKPRTARSFTKSDLTVYDSADNTTLNALAVYGKSEVVDGSIKSAGEGWATVDLGTLTWEYNATNHLFFTSLVTAPLIDSAKGLPCLCSKYRGAYSDTWTGWENFPNNSISCSCNYSTQTHLNLVIKDTSYTDATTFKNSLNGVILCYQLADPTQGNCIAVKTDDGTGINGTMATFTTGTPLRGIPDREVRDVMAWDGSAGTVTKKCGCARLADLTWTYWSSKGCFTTHDLSNQKIITAFQVSPYLCAKYTATRPYIYGLWQDSPNKSIFQSISEEFVVIHDTDYTTVSDFVASLGDTELVYELATPTTQSLTQTENDSIAGLRTFEPQTHAQNNAQTEMTIDYTIRVPTI